MKEPKDLGLKMGTPEEVEWTKIRDAAKLELGQNKRAILLGEVIIKFAEKKITEEKEKFKK